MVCQATSFLLTIYTSLYIIIYYTLITWKLIVVFVVPLSKQKNRNPTHCSLRSFHNHPKLQNGPFWFRFSAATVVFRIAAATLWCQACWRHNLQILPPKMLSRYICELVGTQHARQPPRHSVRSQQQRKPRQEKKRDATFFTEWSPRLLWKGVF